MVRRVIVIASVFVMMVPSSAVAAAIYRDTGYDPDDVGTRDGVSLPDIRSTTRRLSLIDGRRVLAIIVRSYGDWPGFRVEVRLDTKGGPQLDAFMLLSNASGDVCLVWNKGDRSGAIRGRFAIRGDRTACRVPVRFFAPDKRIRWKVRATAPDGAAEVDDAPDNRGWYE